jgi:hypothetical protein
MKNGIKIGQFSQYQLLANNIEQKKEFDEVRTLYIVKYFNDTAYDK